MIEFCIHRWSILIIMVSSLAHCVRTTIRWMFWSSCRSVIKMFENSQASVIFYQFLHFNHWICTLVGKELMLFIKSNYCILNLNDENQEILKPNFMLRVGTSSSWLFSASQGHRTNAHDWSGTLQFFRLGHCLSFSIHLLQ